jgi:hypothetical protein
VVLQRLPAPLDQLTAGGCSPSAVNRIPARGAVARRRLVENLADPAGTPAMEPPGPPATGDGRLAAGVPTGRKLSVSSTDPTSAMSIPVRWRRPGTTWLRFQRPEGQDDRTGVDHVPQPLLEPHAPTVPTARRSASRSTSGNGQPVTPGESSLPTTGTATRRGRCPSSAACPSCCPLTTGPGAARASDGLVQPAPLSSGGWPADGCRSGVQAGDRFRGGSEGKIAGCRVPALAGLDEFHLVRVQASHGRDGELTAPRRPWLRG